MIRSNCNFIVQYLRYLKHVDCGLSLYVLYRFRGSFGTHSKTETHSKDKQIDILILLYEDDFVIVAEIEVQEASFPADQQQD